MLTEKYRSASPLGEAGESLITCIASETQLIPNSGDIHTIRLDSECAPENKAYTALSEIMKDTLEELSSESYVARTVRQYGGSIVIKNGEVAPGTRHDAMGWHIDIRSALILGTLAGTETLSGNFLQATAKPTIGRWLHAVKHRERIAETPTDQQLLDTGLVIEPLQGNAWYELGSDIIHRAPTNTQLQAYNRLFIGVTPPYFLS